MSLGDLIARGERYGAGELSGGGLGFLRYGIWESSGGGLGVQWYGISESSGSCLGVKWYSARESRGRGAWEPGCAVPRGQAAEYLGVKLCSTRESCGRVPGSQVAQHPGVKRQSTWESSCAAPGGYAVPSLRVTWHGTAVSGWWGARRW